MLDSTENSSSAARQPDLARAKPASSKLRHRFEVMTSLLRGWVWETDEQHRFCYLSDSVEAFDGKPPQWYYGKTREDLGFHLADEVARAAYYRQLERQERFGPIEFQRNLIGKLLWRRSLGEPQFDEAGQFAGYCGIAYDITAEVIEREKQGRIDAERRRNLDILMTTIANFPGGIYVADAAKSVLFANDKFYDYLGLPRDRFPVGSKLEDMIDYLHQRGDYTGAEDERSYHRASIDSREPHSIERTRANGVRLMINHAPLPDGGHLRTFADITHRYERLWRLEAAVMQLQSKVRYLESDPATPKLRNGPLPRRRSTDHPAFGATFGPSASNESASAVAVAHFDTDSEPAAG